MASTVWLRLSLLVCALVVTTTRGSGETPAVPPASTAAVPPLTTLVTTPAFDLLPAWKGAATPDVSDATAAAPETLLYLRVSREHLSQRFEKAVDRTKPLVDLILGTRIRGESHTVGNTRLVLVPSDDSFQADIEFTGTVHSKSRGYNGPAVLQLESNSKFRATKRLTLDRVGLSTAPAQTQAKTRVHTRGVQSRYSGLMGKVVERVAQRRFRQSNSQINSIAADHAGKTVADDLDRGVDKALVTLGETFAAAAGLEDVDLKTLTAHRAGQTLHIQLRTTADYAELAMTSEPANWEDLAASLPKIAGAPHVALRVHRSMMLYLAGDRESTPPIAQLLLSTLQSRLAANISAANIPTVTASAPTIGPSPKLSFGMEWLAVDIERPATTELAVNNPSPPTPATVAPPK